MNAVENRLHDMLAELDVELVETDLLDVRFNAAYHARSRTIFARTRLDPLTRVCAIAHELGHAVNNDTCSSSRAERLADEWAATQLIDGNIVEEIARDCGGAPTAIAAELGVTPHLLSVWMQLYETGRLQSLRCINA